NSTNSCFLTQRYFENQSSLSVLIHRIRRHISLPPPRLPTPYISLRHAKTLCNDILPLPFQIQCRHLAIDPFTHLLHSPTLTWQFKAIFTRKRKPLLLHPW